MIVTTTGFIVRLDFSEKFCNFTNYHHTFGKNTRTYNADTSTMHDFEIVSLQRKDETNATILDAISVPHKTQLLNIFDWLFTESEADSLSDDITTANAALAAMVDGSGYSAVMDRMLTDANGKVCPNKVTIVHVGVDDTTIFDFWMGTDDFEDEYTGGDIVVFGPTDTVDELLGSQAEVAQLIAQRTQEDYNTILNAAMRTAPYTSVTSMETQWVNRNDTSETMDITFSFICYGPIKNDAALLQTALPAYINDNTQLPDTAWEVVLPETFTTITLVMVPAWDRLSSGSVNTATFNPIVNPDDMRDVFINNIDDFSETFVNENMEILPTSWQSLSLAVCGAESNLDSFSSISDNLPDYMLAVPDSTDYIRLRSSTQDFIRKLHTYLPYAQNYAVDSSLPSAISVEVTTNATYLIFYSYSIRCKVMVRDDYLTIVGA